VKTNSGLTEIKNYLEMATFCTNCWCSRCVSYHFSKYLWQRPIYYTTVMLDIVLNFKTWISQQSGGVQLWNINTSLWHKIWGFHSDDNSSCVVLWWCGMVPVFWRTMLHHPLKCWYPTKSQPRTPWL